MPDRIRNALPTSAPARDIGLRFGPPAPGGVPAKEATIRFSKCSLVTVTYDAPSGRYAVRQDAGLMPDVRPANIVLQRVEVRPTQYKDVLGLPTPYTVTVGKGEAVVLRDGRGYDGSWRRLAPDTGTRFLDAAGKDIPLKPGETWVLLVPEGQPLSTS